MFIIPRSSLGTAYQPHTGVAYLMAMLKRHKITVQVVDMRLGYGTYKLFEVLNEFNPDVVGVTCYSMGYERAYGLIDKIKLSGNYTVVIGGPHVSAIRGEVLEKTRADFAIKGEGEYTLMELCKVLELRSKKYKEIKGLIWRDGKDGNKVIENEDRPFIHDLDALPFPAYEEFELERYICHNEKRLPIITSRGCPYQCIFCGVRLSMGNKFRARSPQNVVDEIEYWYKKSWKNFDINDDCFTLNLSRAKKICDLIIKRRLRITYQLYNGIRADRIDKELLEKMKESGCTRVYYGCESGNPRILKVIKKGITLERVRKAVEMTNKVGIENAVTFIIGHPSETFKEAMDTVNFAKNLSASFVVFYNLTPYPGTELFSWVEENATFLYPVENYLNNVSSGDRKPIFETEDFTEEERRWALKVGFSLARKKVLQYKLGKALGSFMYMLARYDTLYDAGLKMFLRTIVGKRLYNFLKRGT